MKKYTRQQLQEAIFNLTDGLRWWEIQEATGLPEDRCKELEEIGNTCARICIERRNK